MEGQITSKKWNRVPWSGHWEVTGAGMGVVHGTADSVKSVQIPIPGQPFIQHSSPAEANNAISEAQRINDAKLIELRKNAKAQLLWSGPTKKMISQTLVENLFSSHGFQ